MTYPALELLVQAYLTIDWPDDYADVWAAVDDYVANEPVADRLPDEVIGLLDSTPSEQALREVVLVQLGSGYLPEADGLTVRDWLLAVCRRVRGPQP